MRMIRGATLLLAAAALAACDSNAPTIQLQTADYNCGKPEVVATIANNGAEISNIIVNWGRNNLATEPPQLYATDTLGPQFGAPGNWAIRNASGQSVTLPQSSDLEAFMRFEFDTPLAANEKLAMNLQVQYDNGGGVQSAFSDRLTIPFEETCPTDEGDDDGSGGTGGGTGAGTGPVVDNSPTTCPDPLAPDGGLAVPAIDPGAADGPVDGEACAGTRSGNAAVVNFAWRPVDGVANGVKAYQVEVVHEDGASCLGDWNEGGSAHWSGSNDSCIIFDTNANASSEDLLPNTNYRWRVRGSCRREDDSLASGAFTPFMAYQTVGEPEKLTTRVPAGGSTVPTPFPNTTATTVNFEWLPVDCGPGIYHLRVVEAFQAPEDDDDLIDFPNATASDGPGQTVTVDGEARVRMTVSLAAGESYVWWVYADSPQGTTPVLTLGDLQSFSIEE